MCVELYGEENIMGTIVWKNATDNNPTNIATEHEYILVVARGKEALETEWKSAVSDVKELLIKVGNELTKKHSGQKLTDAYESWYREHKPELWPLDRYKYIDEQGIYTGSQSVHNPGKEGYRYDLLHPKTGRACKQPLMGYRFPESTMNTLVTDGRILFGDDENKIVELKVYASEYQEKLASVLELDGRLGAYDLKDDFKQEGKVFSNPKPVRLLNSFFPFILKGDGDIVLDFFAGSGTTGKAIYELNKLDSKNRRYVLVQVPEPLDPDAKEQKASVKLCDALGKPRRISELTKERLRRAAKAVKDEAPLISGDTGFRVFKLDKSNIREWNPDQENLAQTLLDHHEHIVDGRTEADIVYELLLKLGLDLCVPMESRTVAGKTVGAVGGGVLMLCLAENISAKEVEPIAAGIVAWHKELAPAGDSTVVFRDSAFADDVAKTNMAAILAQNGLENVRSL